RRVQNGDKEILMNGDGKQEVVKVNMNIYTIRAFTGHSDRNELIRFIYDVDPKPKKVIVNHGESSKCLELASTIHKTQKIETVAPKNLEAVRIK
ncbi:MAG: beta-CASP ribonuclease aCPSF1, partial [Candidatus Woesearchaeota archaeon]|nr:beta-CASP ribonuclease aCPSF1 [Candidatus Woesearchaeota archaeon]